MFGLYQENPAVYEDNLYFPLSVAFPIPFYFQNIHLITFHICGFLGYKLENDSPSEAED